MTKPLTPERIAELRGLVGDAEHNGTIAIPVTPGLLDLLCDAAEELEREKSRPGSQSAWAQMRLERDLAREDRDALRAEVERIREAARPHLIGLWYDSADLDGEPRGYLCIHCAEIHDEHYPTEAEIQHKPDCALWRKP